MALNFFKRRSTDEYGDQETSRLASFLFGFFALFVTLLVAAGLFFGGRAIYRVLNGNDNKTATQQGQNTSSNTEKKPASKQPSTSTSQNSSSNPPKSPNTGDTPSSVPNTGDQPLPRTGDPGL